MADKVVQLTDKDGNNLFPVPAKTADDVKIPDNISYISPSGPDPDIPSFPQSFYAAIYPIGSIYISISSTNPGGLFPGTTWVAFGQGRTLVGVNTSDSDFNASQKTGGEKTHTLLTSEMPSHSHTIANMWAASGGSGSKNVIGGYPSTGAGQYNMTSNNTGGDGAHNNMQPYITVYMWRRTS